MKHILGIGVARLPFADAIIKDDSKAAPQTTATKKLKEYPTIGNRRDAAF